jgi:hypothetical protein
MSRILGYVNQYKQDRADTSAFKKKAYMARKEAYRKEALKVAGERGRRAARTKGFGEILFPSAYRQQAKPSHKKKARYVYKKVRVRR